MAVMVLFISLPISFGLKAQAASITTAYINGSDVRVRETPSAANNNNIIEKISYTSATVLEKKEISAGEIWYKISYKSSGAQKSGWIFYNSEYIQIVTYNPDASFEEKIKAFPESYRDALRALHAQYPKWEFIPDVVNTSFSDAVAVQNTDMRKQVQIGSSIQPVSWRSMGPGSYDWSKKDWVSTNGGWTGASREAIAYYMDPRNFLNSEEIYMFLDQRYNSALQNEEGVQKIIKGTFLENNYTPASGETGGGSYVKVIMAAAQASGVNPYIIASKIIQEQGVTNTSSLITGTQKGYEGYYNFFNIGAYGANRTEVIINGLERAKNNGWNTRYKSILGGAEFLGKNYILKGQDTYYYQDFNVHGGGSHQYAQAVHDAYSKGVKLANTYKSDTAMALSFRIPVFVNMPSASPIPVKNDKRNNYYFSNISVAGLTPSFSMYVTSYDLAVQGDTTINVAPVDGAVYASSSKYTLKAGQNKVVLTVKAETGYTTDYVININAANINASGSTGSGSNSSGSKVFVGDANGDGKITRVDLAAIRLHLLDKKRLSGNNLSAADINGDRAVTRVDLAAIRLHLLGKKTIQH